MPGYLDTLSTVSKTHIVVHISKVWKEDNILRAINSTLAHCHVRYQGAGYVPKTTCT